MLYDVVVDVFNDILKVQQLFYPNSKKLPHIEPNTHVWLSMNIKGHLSQIRLHKSNQPSNCLSDNHMIQKLTQRLPADPCNLS